MNARRRIFDGFATLGKLSEEASRAFLFLGIGTLRLKDFNEMTRQSWRAFASDHAEIHSGLNHWEETTYRRFVNGGERVCIVGCGSGRDLLPFADTHDDVVGIEPSPQPVATLRRILRERGQSAIVIQASIEEAVLPGMFDVFLFSLNCYGYIPGSNRRIAVLRKLAAHLNAQGRIFVSYPGRTSNWANRSVKLATMMAWLTRSDWHVEPYDALQRLQVEGKPAAIIYEHFFVPQEVEREAEHAGLHVHCHSDPWATPFAVLGR